MAGEQYVRLKFWANGIPSPPSANPGTEAVYSTNVLDLVVDVLAYFK
jgi:hypothetical protein